MSTMPCRRRRRYNRYVWDGEVAVACSSAVVSGTVKDISLGGLRVKVFGIPPWEERSKVYFTVPGIIKGQATVRWTHRSESGLEIETDSAEVSRLVELILSLTRGVYYEGNAVCL